MSIVDINRGMLLSFVFPFTTSAFEVMFNSHELPEKSFVEWDGKSAIPAAKKIMTSMKVKALRRKSELGMSQLSISKNLGLRELKTELIHQVPRVSLAVHLCALKDI